MKTMTTGEGIAEALVAHGVDTVFGIPGAHMYGFNDALYGVRDKIRMIHTRHEQGAGYMAYGYAKSTGKTGVYTVVPGPGVLNSGAALCTAYGANAPVLCVTGNIMSHLIGQGRGQLHELPDQLATLRGLTKWTERINHPSEVSSVMDQAFHEMRSGRQGPVAVEAPWDVFGKKGPIAPAEISQPDKPALDPDAIAEAAKMINAAKNPMIMVGGGAVEAASAVLELAKLIQAPVTAHRSGKGIVSDDSPYALSLVAAYDYWQKCDLLIGIGSRLELQFMRWRWKPAGVKILRIDIDPTEMVRLKPDFGVVADSRDGVTALVDALGGKKAAGNREAEFADYQARARKAFEGVQPQLGYLDAIREVLPRDGFFVEEVSQVGFTGRFGFPVYEPRQYVTCGYQDNLGFGYNTALGVKIANPNKAVVSISGDGGFMFGVQELATAVQHKINVVSIVFNNSAYGNVMRDQMQTYQGRYIGSKLDNPDFVKLAESFGVSAERVGDPGALKKALSKALSFDRPSLIEVAVKQGSETSPWPFLHPEPYSS
ncbi:MAG: hypothetical protein K8F25_17900 [Fimbriimonadaceae bacterium]|nr:hypothetical protein [Alphaproteobacteria bacterium]